MISPQCQPRSSLSQVGLLRRYRCFAIQLQILQSGCRAPRRCRNLLDPSGDPLVVSVALLSNPQSTGNKRQLPRVRRFCVEHHDIFHYEVDEVGQVGDALATIASVRPRILVINGGDGTVQAILTELHNGGHFGTPPPVAVLPNGKTNLIALDLGSVGDPVVALARALQLARSGLSDHLVSRELIVLSSSASTRPTVGMFLGGAGLADAILYCRHSIYPIGLPNGLSHALAALAVLLSILLRVSGRLLPPRPRPVAVRLRRDGVVTGCFSVLIVTTLSRLLLSIHTGEAGSAQGGRLKLLAVDSSIGALVRLLIAGVRGRLGTVPLGGVHLGRSDELEIEGDRSRVILDGELFTAGVGEVIRLRSTQPMDFVHLAA